MARIDWVEARLREWAQFLLVGDGSGYSRINPLHHEWQPPSKGQMPTMKAGSPSHVRDTHAAVGMLSGRLQDTLAIVYLTNMAAADKAARLGCLPATVDARVQTAHRRLAGVLRN